jgi:hypothetical protein
MLNLWGLDGGYSRDPFFSLDREQVEKLRKILEQTGWIDPDHALDDVV